MATSSFHLRGLEPQVMAFLKKEAKRQHISVNLLILNNIRQSAGLAGIPEKKIWHDLDHLAGTWTKSEAKDFQKNTAFFEKIDKDLW